MPHAEPAANHAMTAVGPLRGACQLDEETLELRQQWESFNTDPQLFAGF